MSNVAALGLEVEFTTHRVMLFHPKTGLPLVDEVTGEQAWIEIDGMNSEAGEKLKKAARLRLAAQQRGGRPAKVDLDREREENAQNLATLTRNWFLVNAQTKKAIAAEDYPCTYANAVTIYGNERSDWIAAQVSADLFEQANFIKA